MLIFSIGFSKNKMSETDSQNNFNKLVKYQNLISVSFSALVLLLYFSFIIIVGFKPELFAPMVFNETIPIGIVFGISIIIFSIFLTILYVIISNFFLDNLRKKIEQ